MVDYQRLEFCYRRNPDQDVREVARHPVVVVGAGPVGLVVALDLARQGLRVVLLDDDNKLSTGSRAICFAKRTLEIFDRVGVGQRMVDKGVTWNLGRVFLRDEPLFQFDLSPEAGHRRPAFINLQQYYVEGFLADAVLADERIDLRWQHALSDLTQDDDGVTVRVHTLEGPYQLRADWVIAADGARSLIRKMMGLESKGRFFRDRFLIADVRMDAPFPAERWFWFDPPFHPNQSVLLHQQPDGIWRTDFQLGWDADPDEERKPERVLPRVRALLGKDVEFELQWVSIYTFACLRMDRFRHGRVLFAGDSAHGVSPFGARGANSGIQDADNLAWKLAMVLRGEAPGALLDSYNDERVFAADENILNSTRSTDFLTPKSEVSRAFRDAALDLARDCPFARKLVNSGRLSLPSTYVHSPLNTHDTELFAGSMAPGAPCADAPVRTGGKPGWLIDLLGNRFVALVFGPVAAQPVPGIDLITIAPGAVEDSDGKAAERYDARPGTTYLIRPDQHVAARFRRFDADVLLAAKARATAQSSIAALQ